MCGIAGIWHREGVHPTDLLGMSQQLRHRGPDDEGFLLYTDKSSYTEARAHDTISALDRLPHLETIPAKTHTLGLLHRRLSIIDVSPSGHQPMALNHRFSIVFNGEIYNYLEIRKELESLGYLFKTGSDTEVILYSFEEWGPLCVDRFIGMWSFVLLDIDNQSLFISRDRFGIKPFYYSFGKDHFAFASEIKALTPLPFVSSELNIERTVEYLSFGITVDPNRPIYEDIQELPPGHNMQFSLADGAAKTYQYYNLDQAAPATLHTNVEKGIQAYGEQLQDAIALHLRADVPVGVTLSGGLDSSAIAAISAINNPETAFQTFTASFKGTSTDETAFADAVSSRYPNLHPNYVNPDAQSYLDTLEKLLWHQDLPVNSTSIFAHWEVMRITHEKGLKVILEGQGADEALGGYYQFAGFYLMEQIKRLRFGRFLKERSKLKTNFTPAINQAFARAAFYYLPQGAQRKVHRRQRHGMHFIAADYKEVVDRIKVPERGGKSFREQSLLNMQFGLKQILRQVDRNSMAFSVESRVPFLDHRLVEAAIALPLDAKIKDGWTKYALRQSIASHLPDQVTWRKDKLGFAPPQKEWREQAVKQVVTYINDRPLPALLDKKYIEGLSKGDLNSNSALSEYWKIFSFMKWIEAFDIKL